MFANIGVCALSESVDACVCPSGSVNTHGPAGDALKGVLEIVLDRVAMRLTLPAGERRAVISYDKFQSSRHGNLYTTCIAPCLYSESDAGTPAHRRAGCAYSKAYAKQLTPLTDLHEVLWECDASSHRFPVSSSIADDPLTGN